LSVLLLAENLFHLFYRDCTFNVDPLVLDEVVLAHLQYNVHALDVFVGDEAEASWLVGPFVLQDYDVIDQAKLLEVVSEDFYGEVVR